MQLKKWDPWSEFASFFDHYARALPRLPLGSQEVLATGDWTPRVDISETDTEFSIKAEIPGVEKENVSVSVESRVMTIRGEKKQEKEEKDKTLHRVERRYGSFTRSFTLPDSADEKGVKAAFKDGVLTVTVKKIASAQPKAIEIKVE